MHSVPITFSPSSLRMTRSTPCVDGCCGPIFRTSSVESKNVTSAIYRLLAAFDPEVLLHPALVLLQNSVILAQRVSFPFLGHQNAAHVRMTFEFNPEHVEDFAFQPVRRQVDANR